MPSAVIATSANRPPRKNDIEVIHSLTTVEGQRSTIYPTQFRSDLGRHIARSADAAVGLNQYGLNRTPLEPGVISAQRHWHSRKDQFVYILKGTLAIATATDRERLSVGMSAPFPAGEVNDHQIVSRRSMPAPIWRKARERKRRISCAQI